MRRSSGFDQVAGISKEIVSKTGGGRSPNGLPRSTGWTGAFAVVLLLFAASTESFAMGRYFMGPREFQIEVLSSAADQISGNDARVEIQLPPGIWADQVKVYLNGADVTDVFDESDRGRELQGVVSGLELGDNELEVRGEETAWPWSNRSPKSFPDPALSLTHTYVVS